MALLQTCDSGRTAEIGGLDYGKGLERAREGETMMLGLTDSLERQPAAKKAVGCLVRMIGRGRILLAMRCDARCAADASEALDE